ncbi:hypothetical protein ABIA33_007401 [Streptacidiphilus sp. MAP12-16]|jgi:hypothetical protein|uniref:hypothetical protein n=1 Tax=Streptacidiphilus sp. MAP12-16 TaxID=3156300 RepID=UPI003514178C
MVQNSDSGAPPEGPRDPFAPPPKDAPDRPWQPRGRAAVKPQGREEEQGPQDSPPQDPSGDRPPVPPVPPPHPWSPGYQGQQPPRLPYGPPPQGPRFDPTDPVQRRARYALLSGMWGIFFLILGVPYVTLLLSSLALYWSISALRGTAKTPPPPTTGTPTGYGHGYSPYPVRPQVPAATGGLIAAIVGLSLVATVFGVQMYYKSFYDCQANALTKAAYSSCATTVTPRPPAWLVQLGG